jgi:hypothetical protein
MIKMMKTANRNNKIIPHNKNKNITTTNLKSIKNLKNYFFNGINHDREFLEFKMDSIVVNTNEKAYINFDSEMKMLINKTEYEEEPIIKGDVSYNISVSIYKKIIFLL